MKLAVARADAPVESVKVTLHAHESRAAGLVAADAEVWTPDDSRAVTNSLPISASRSRNAALVSGAQRCYLLRTHVASAAYDFLWSVSVVCATRSTQYLAAPWPSHAVVSRHDSARLVGAWVLKGLGGAGLWFFVWSGFRLRAGRPPALYEALPRIWHAAHATAYAMSRSPHTAH